MLWSNLSLPLANKTDFPGEHPDPPGDPETVNPSLPIYQGVLARLGADSRLFGGSHPVAQRWSAAFRTIQQETPARSTKVPLPPLNRMQRARSSDGLMEQLWYQLGKALSQP